MRWSIEEQVWMIPECLQYHCQKVPKAVAPILTDKKQQTSAPYSESIKKQISHVHKRFEKKINKKKRSNARKKTDVLLSVQILNCFYCF